MVWGGRPPIGVPEVNEIDYMTRLDQGLDKYRLFDNIRTPMEIDSCCFDVYKM